MAANDTAVPAPDLPEELERQLWSLLDQPGSAIGEHVQRLVDLHPDHAIALRGWWSEVSRTLALPAQERRVGSYRLLRLLGRGGMGEVHLAEHVQLGRQVALKLMRDDAAFSPAVRARFAREARVISRIDHPHICPVFEVGEDRDRRSWRCG